MRRLSHLFLGTSPTEWWGACKQCVRYTPSLVGVGVSMIAPFALGYVLPVAISCVIWGGVQVWHWGVPPEEMVETNWRDCRKIYYHDKRPSSIYTYSCTEGGSCVHMNISFGACTSVDVYPFEGSEIAKRQQAARRTRLSQANNAPPPLDSRYTDTTDRRVDGLDALPPALQTLP